MSFFRTTTGKLAVLALIWMAVGRLSFLFLPPQPWTATPWNLAVTLPPGATQALPVVAPCSPKAGAPLWLRLRGPAGTSLRVRVFDEEGFATFGSGRGTTPIHDASVALPLETTIRLPRPREASPEVVCRYYVVFSNPTGATTTFRASAQLGPPSGMTDVLQRMLFVGLLVAAIFGAFLAGLWRKNPQPPGEFYAVPPSPPRS